tara:strand:+ start:2672 stop:3997 length:1326 start_codon:yes stop_codon:yes gene_type:complete
MIEINKIKKLIKNRDFNVGIIGLGYVGLPLALEFLQKGFKVIGHDIDKSKIDKLSQGIAYISHLDNELIQKFITNGSFEVSANKEIINEMDAVMICVPTPIDKNRIPNLDSVISTAESIAKNMKEGTIISLESSTYPGTTRDIIKPILDKSKFKIGDSYFLCYSPEREDPGNKEYKLKNIPKIIGCDDPQSLEVGKHLYSNIVENVHDVSSSSAAEAVKLSENIFRAVNISLSNELKIIYKEMGIDIWEVIDAAATKPFGYMAFYPGPGVGGHCIPIDPFYLTYKAKEFNVTTRFIELAGELNVIVLDHTIQSLINHINFVLKKSISEAKLLILGLAYKKDVDDMRESPSVYIFNKLKKLGAEVNFNDDYIPIIPKTREHKNLEGIQSETITAEKIKKYDGVIVLTDHSYYDLDLIFKHSKLIFDTRNLFKNFSSEKIIKL